MRRSRSKNSSRIPGTGIFNQLLSLAEGVWSSLRRFLRRLLLPNRGRRNRVEVQAENSHDFCPLVGLEKFRKAESLTVDELMANVEWRGVERNTQRRKSKPALNKTALTPGLVATQEISSKNFHICSLAGVEQYSNHESLTVNNLMEKVQWRVPKSTNKTSSTQSVATVQKEINWD